MIIDLYHGSEKRDQHARLAYQGILKEYRNRLGISQAELSKRSGVHIRSIQQYEIGAKDIKKASVTTVIALSKALYCDTEDLLSF